uniref:Uncharacterized protein n=1 Tax=Medicago truncatula TaxID=3880 RepID=I3S933_MEDTR|nr:unknown [Medicago truncatula]
MFMNIAKLVSNFPQSDSLMGLSSAFFFKQLSANLAIFLAASGEYCFLSRGSIIKLNLLLSAG